MIIRMLALLMPTQKGAMKPPIVGRVPLLLKIVLKNRNMPVPFVCLFLFYFFYFFAIGLASLVRLDDYSLMRDDLSEVA